MNGTDLLLHGFAVAALRSATPLLFALLGETLTQQAGRVNLGVEGQMLMGAVAGYGTAAATGDAWLALLAGAAAGALLSAVFALLTVAARANAFASGLATWMLGYGVSAYAGTGLVGHPIDGFTPLAWGVTPTMVAAVLLVPVTGTLLYCTRGGLHWRVVGQSPAAAYGAGIPVARTLVVAIITGGLLSGLGGAALSVDYTRTWAEGMTEGRGLIAVGLVIVARWNPWLALPAALLFGAADSLSLRLQAADSPISAHLLRTLPYLVSLIVYAASCARQRRHPGATAAPAALGDVFGR